MTLLNPGSSSLESLERPKLRPLITRRIEHQGQPYLALSDPFGVMEGTFVIPWTVATALLRHFDGHADLEEILQRLADETGQVLGRDELRAFVGQLDEAFALDGPRYHDYLETYQANPIREAALAGRSYDADPQALRVDLDAFFDHPEGSGRPEAIGPIPGKFPASSSSLRAIVCPHIDFQRGGPTYTWAYRELVERSEADTFIVLGVAHKGSQHRFALTRKHFQTPLGRVETDIELVERLADRAGRHLFDDELTHRTEHSIEFQAVFLQHVLGDHRPFRIVPVLVGSFHDLMERGVEPIDDPEVARFVEALRDVERFAEDRMLAYIGSIDFGHIGREFGDPDLIGDATLTDLDRFDAGLIDRAIVRDPSGWFAHASRVGDRYRTCGLAATYTMLHAIGPARGRLLRYRQAVDASRTCCVSFASMVFDAIDPTNDPGSPVWSR